MPSRRGPAPDRRRLPVPVGTGRYRLVHWRAQTRVSPRCRCFESVADFNAQFGAWLRRANQRIPATTKIRPAEAIYEDRGAMVAFPAGLPDPAPRFGLRLARDHYVRVDTNDYSVNPRFVGRRIEVRVDVSSVTATRDGTEVARHPRCLARHQSLLAPDHARVLSAMRAERAVVEAFGAAVEERDLAVYNRITEVA
jgi:hypothetical protein